MPKQLSIILPHLFCFKRQTNFGFIRYNFVSEILKVFFLLLLKGDKTQTETMPIGDFEYLLRSLNVEKKKSANRKQDFVKRIFNYQTSFVVTAAAIALGLGTSSLLREKVLQPQREELSDHPMCGIPTGGKVNFNWS